MPETNGNYGVNWQALLEHVARCDYQTLVSMALEISQVLEAIEKRMEELVVT